MKKLFTMCILVVVAGLIEGKLCAASCECFFTNNPWIFYIDPEQTVTEQFYITRSQECEPPSYIWSDDCLMGNVDQNGLFTVPPSASPETCTACVTDSANTYPGGLPVECCVVVEIATPPDSDGDGRPVFMIIV
jgi:hypothetical protein